MQKAVVFLCLDLFLKTVSQPVTACVLAAELGIDISGILKKSRGIFLGRFSSADVEELDMGGPLVFAALLACAHVLVRPKCAGVGYTDANAAGTRASMCV